MTSARYRSYRHAVDLLDCLEDDTIDPAGRERLRLFAQDLLLTREMNPDALRVLREEAREALAQLQGGGRLEEAIATHLLHAIFACGPESLEPDQLGAPELLELA